MTFNHPQTNNTGKRGFAKTHPRSETEAGGRNRLLDIVGFQGVKTVDANDCAVRDPIKGKKHFALFCVDKRAEVITFHEVEGKGEDIGGRDAEKRDGETCDKTLAERQSDPDAGERPGAERHDERRQVLDCDPMVREHLRDFDGQHFRRVALLSRVALLYEPVFRAKDKVEKIHGIVEAEEKPI